jgi:type IV secretory pathway VirB2 component (pilin)
MSDEGSVMKAPVNKLPSRKNMQFVIATLAVLALLLVSGDVLAQAKLDMPYNQGLSAFRESLRGPVPFAISLVGIVACGAMLIFGGEISGFMRTMIFIILVVAVIVQADNIVTGLGGKDPGTSTTRNSLDLRGSLTTRNLA